MCINDEYKARMSLFSLSMLSLYPHGSFTRTMKYNTNFLNCIGKYDAQILQTTGVTMVAKSPEKDVVNISILNSIFLTCKTH